MSTASAPAPGPVVVTGANGLVGSTVCRELADRGVPVRGIVRRPGAAPDVAGLTEHVGDFDDPAVAGPALDGAVAVVSTVAPMSEGRRTQHRVSVEGTTRLARQAAAANVARLVHVSTAAVYRRDTGTGDVDEDSALVDDDAGTYPTTKRDADRSLARVEGLTIVLVRPPAIAGPGPTSVWNTIRPGAFAEDPSTLTHHPEDTWAWVHVADLARFLADVATGAIASAASPEDGPVAGQTTPVNVAAPKATSADYVGTLAEALDRTPVWSDEPGWQGAILADRARRWGWSPQVTLEEAMAELRAGLR